MTQPIMSKTAIPTGITMLSKMSGIGRLPTIGVQASVPVRRASLCRMARIVASLVLILMLGAVVAASSSQRAFAAGEMNMDGMSDMETADSDASDSSSASDAEEEEQLGLMPRLWRLTGESTPASDESGYALESVGAVFPNLLSLTTTPGSISVGIECNGDMCLIDPCTCGKPDAWGHCACAGFEDVSPTITVYMDDPDVARVVDFAGQTWLMPLSSGDTHVTITAELVHYQSASYEFDLHVEPFGIVDVLLIVALIIVIALIVLLIVLLVRWIVRLIRSQLRKHRHWRQRADALKEEHPLAWQTMLRAERYADKRESSHTSRSEAHRAAPFRHDVFIALQRALPVFVAGLAVFVVLVPLSTTMVEDVSIFSVDYTHDQIKYQLYAPGLSWIVNAACVCYGALLALVLFRFLLAKRDTTAFFSVGLSRTSLFLSRYLVGLVCVVVGIGVPFLLSFILNGIALGFYDGFGAEFAYVTYGYITVALVSFALASIATMRAGTLFEACAFTLTLLLSITVILGGVGVLSEYLLVGNAAGMTLYGQDSLVEPSFLDQLSWLNPVLFFSDEGALHQYFMVLHPVYYPESGPWYLIVGWFAVFLVLAVIAAFALVRRRGEQAVMAGRSPVFSFVFVALFGLAVFSLVVYVLGSVDIVISIAVGAVAFLILSALLLFGPLRGRTARPVTFTCIAGELVVMAAVVAVIATGGLGFSSYVPDTDDVESVEVSYVGSPSYLTDEFSGVSGGASYYYTSYRTYDSDTSIDIVRSLHSQLIESANTPRETDYIDFEETTVPYDVLLRYQLSDGSTVVRYFDQATIDELSALLTLDNDEHSHELERAVITGDTAGLTDDEVSEITQSPSYGAYRSGRLYASDGALNRILEVTCSDEDRADLLEAIADDLESLSASERYAPTSSTRAVLMFTLSPEVDVSSFGYSFNNALIYVNDEWTHTLAWLESQGLLAGLEESLDARIIESLTFQLDDPYGSINKVTSPVARYFMAYRSESANQYWLTQDYGALKEIDDTSRIAEILPNLRTGCYMTGGYLVQAKLAGIEAYVYFYLPTEYAPSDL